MKWHAWLQIYFVSFFINYLVFFIVLNNYIIFHLIMYLFSFFSLLNTYFFFRYQGISSRDSCSDANFSITSFIVLCLVYVQCIYSYYGPYWCHGESWSFSWRVYYYNSFFVYVLYGKFHSFMHNSPKTRKTFVTTLYHFKNKYKNN